MIVAALIVLAAAQHQAPKPHAPWKLEIYPKLLPLQPGDQIIVTRKPRPNMEEALPVNPFERTKDTRTWA